MSRSQSDIRATGRSTVVQIDVLESGEYRAYQNDVGLEGVANNPARAVARFADKVAREHYES